MGFAPDFFLEQVFFAEPRAMIAAIPALDTKSGLDSPQLILALARDWHVAKLVLYVGAWHVIRPPGGFGIGRWLPARPGAILRDCRAL